VGAVFYDPWLIAVASQLIGGVLSGVIVYYLTQGRTRSPTQDMQRPPRDRPRSSVRTTASYRLDRRYLVYYLVLLSGIIGLTLLQDPTSISWFQIFGYVITVTWWSMVALNVFVLTKFGVPPMGLPGPLVLFVCVIFPVIGHTKSVQWTLFTFIAKFALAVFVYGILSRLFDVDTGSIIMSILLVSFALVDTFIYAYILLARNPEFSKWGREGYFIIGSLG
jgi:hypothetical protein